MIHAGENLDIAVRTAVSSHLVGRSAETHYDSINMVAFSQLFHNGHKCKEETTKKHHFFVLLTTLAISEFYSVV